MKHIDLDSNTITALSTPPGKGGIGVIRISGSQTLLILSEIIEKWRGHPRLLSRIQPGHLYHSYILSNEKRIDECMVVYFKTPNSYTGEDSAEISFHSNPFLTEEILDIIRETNSHEIRLALPGEFTYRAYKNGKLDLIQAESVNELINANSRFFARMKFGSLEGKLSRVMMELKEDLIQLGIAVETGIEFEEDQFLEGITITEKINNTMKRIDSILSASRFNEQLNRGLNVVIVGKVNVGKSSLFNLLLMEERSITSSIPGTTRDFIREKIYLDGFPVEITDVAGINRETKDDIEVQGIQRSLDKVKNADAIIFMVDASRPFDKTDKEIFYLIKKKKKIIVANKLDILAPDSWENLNAFFEREKEDVSGISVKDQINIEGVTQFLKQIISELKKASLDSEFTANKRQRQLLEELKQILRLIKKMVEAQSSQIEIIGEEIRSAISIIGQLMGEITPEEILNRIFSEFCIGK